MMSRRLLAALVAALLAAACATPPDYRFYTLDADPAPATATDAPLTLAIGPVDLPQYLDRPQIVTRNGDNRLDVDEFNRWGGALDEEIYRVLAGRLGARLGTQRIYAYPSRIVASTDYRIALEISLFDGALGGPVALDAAWSLIDDRSGDVVDVQRVRYAGAADGPDHAAYAAALSRLLQRLGDDLARAVGDANKNPSRRDG